MTEHSTSASRRPRRLVTFGDSHSLWTFAGVHPAKILHVGPVTMHRASRDTFDSLLPRWYRPRSSDLLLISFGEIDCRQHVMKQAAIKNVSVMAEIDDLCDRYEKEVTRFRKTFPGRISLCCIVPPGTSDPWHNPLYASPEAYRAAQIAIRDRMNERLAAIPGVLFFDFRPEITADDGCMRADATDDLCHLDPFSVAGSIIADKLQDDENYPFVTYRRPPKHPRDMARKRGAALRLWTRPIRYRIKRFFGLPAGADRKERKPQRQFG